MDELNFKQLFYLFCCPPCKFICFLKFSSRFFRRLTSILKCCRSLFAVPSRITAKMAFLPPKLTYDLTEKSSSVDEEPESQQASAASKQKDAPKDYEFTYSSEYIGVDEKYITDFFEVFYTKTKRKNNIACLHIKCSKKKESKYTLLFSHGNAADLGMLTGFYMRIVNLLNVNLFSYDYSGYGKSSGRASEKNLYSDIEAAWKILLEKYNLKPEQVILYGQSIGTAPTVDLATKHNPAGVVLHSPLMSGIRLLFPVKRTFMCDAFPIIDKIAKVKSPTLVIHGTSDEIINFSHGLQIYENLENPVEPLW